MNLTRDDTRIFNWTIYALLGLGIVLIIHLLITGQIDSKGANTEKIIGFLSIPLGLLSKLFQWLNQERNKLGSAIEENRSLIKNLENNMQVFHHRILNTNEEIEAHKRNTFERESSINEKILNIDRRFLRIEVQYSLSGRIEKVEQMSEELHDRLTKYVLNFKEVNFDDD